MTQTTQSGRIITLVAVQNGNVFVAAPGGTVWWPTINNTGVTLNTTGVVRSASNNQKLWFADGSHYLYYDPSDNTVHNWVASTGSLPVGTDGGTPRLICTWRGRTVLSGLVKDAQNWFMSAIGDPTSWNTNPFPPVVTSAITGNNAPMGLIGDVVTSLVPISDDILLMGCDHTLWQFSGDPNDGGRLDNISTTIGMPWGNPWCRGPDGTCYFVSNKLGVYAYTLGSPPVRMSQQIEQLLFAINTGTNEIRMLWDDRWQGFHLFVSATASASATTHFFWEQRTGAWWTDVFTNNNHNPIACTTFDGNLPGDRHQVIGAWDSYVRTMSPTATNDDGTAISSAVVIGPLLTKDMGAVLLKDLQAVLGETSASISYAVYVGATAEAALSSSPVATGTWNASRNPNTLIRWMGHAIWVELTSSSQWAIEQIRARVQDQGRVQTRGYKISR